MLRYIPPVQTGGKKERQKRKMNEIKVIFPLLYDPPDDPEGEEE